MGFSESKPVTPSGRPAPVPCMFCLQEQHVCTCPAPANDNGSSIAAPTLYYSEATQAAASVAADALVTLEKAILSESRPKLQLPGPEVQCEKCIRHVSLCTCVEQIDQREMLVREQMTQDKQIDMMTSLLDSMAILAAVKSVEKFIELKDRGEFLGHRSDLLMQYVGQGVLTGKMIGAHQEQMQLWLADCEKFIVEVCSKKIDNP